MQRRQPRPFRPVAPGTVRVEQLRLVVAEHGLTVHLPIQREHAETVGTPCQQIAHEEHAIGGAGRELIQELPELRDAAVHVADDDRSRHLAGEL